MDIARKIRMENAFIFCMVFYENLTKSLQIAAFTQWVYWKIEKKAFA